MSELHELRKELLKHYDTTIELGVNSASSEGYLLGLRTAISLVVQKIEEEENKMAEYFLKDKLSEL